ncbi:CBS domain-containing protein, partial [uncultured Parolsenella sp.]|uniref:CBS domain-containing protein n=1 Tax=uncultured Parolsenella sp. TaxID=2083008 RepID=UPI0027D9B897
GMADADASRMLSEMDPDDAAELVSELDYDRAEKLLRLMGINEQRAIRQLLGYKDDTAGRIMTSEFVAVPRATTVAEVSAKMRGLPDDFEPVNYVYVTDDEDKLAGVVSVRRLFVSDPDTTLDKLVGDDEVISAKPDDDQEDVAEDIAKYNLLAMPVVDEKTGKILGVVTVDDALDVLEEEHEEDLQIAGGSSGDAGSHEGSGELVRLIRHQMWFFFWMAAELAMALAWGAAPALAVGFALPAALLVADEMVHYVTAFFLEHDEDDEDAPSLGGFAVKGIALGVFWALVVLLVAIVTGRVVATTDGAVAAASLALAGFQAASVAVLVSFVTAPAYLVLLRRRDDAGKDTSGTVLHVVALAIALAAFAAAVLVTALPLVG